MQFGFAKIAAAALVLSSLVNVSSASPIHNTPIHNVTLNTTDLAQMTFTSALPTTTSAIEVTGNVSAAGNECKLVKRCWNVCFWGILCHRKCRDEWSCGASYQPEDPKPTKPSKPSRHWTLDAASADETEVDSSAVSTLDSCVWKEKCNWEYKPDGKLAGYVCRKKCATKHGKKPWSPPRPPTPIPSKQPKPPKKSKPSKKPDKHWYEDAWDFFWDYHQGKHNRMQLASNGETESYLVFGSENEPLPPTSPCFKFKGREFCPAKVRQNRDLIPGEFIRQDGLILVLTPEARELSKNHCLEPSEDIELCKAPRLTRADLSQTFTKKSYVPESYLFFDIDGLVFADECFEFKGNKFCRGKDPLNLLPDEFVDIEGTIIILTEKAFDLSNYHCFSYNDEETTQFCHALGPTEKYEVAAEVEELEMLEGEVEELTEDIREIETAGGVSANGKACKWVEDCNWEYKNGRLQGYICYPKCVADHSKPSKQRKPKPKPKSKPNPEKAGRIGRVIDWYERYLGIVGRKGNGVIAIAQSSDNTTTPATSSVVARGADHTYPQMGEWKDFDTMFALNREAIKLSCTYMHPKYSTTPDIVTDTQIEMIRQAILQISGETGVDARYILAIMMQESHGCLSVNTTWNAVRNPGLMQSHNGEEYVGNGAPEHEQRRSITQMIRDGAAGTYGGTGLGLRSCLDMFGGRHFSAARCYNSGPNGVNEEDLDAPMGATEGYPREIGQRLTGRLNYRMF